MSRDIQAASAVAFALQQVQLGAYDKQDSATAEILQGALRHIGEDASALIAEAKRYRWLRDTFRQVVLDPGEGCLDGADLDAAIDAQASA